jgi:hypothetical protein
MIATMDTKKVLYRTRGLGWATDTERCRSQGELEEHFLARLGPYGRLGTFVVGG